MPVYMIIETKTLDKQRYDQYIAKVPPIIEAYGGKYLARTSDVTPGMGGWRPERIILLEFPSREHIRRCFSSPEYREIAHLREASTAGRSVIVDGVEEGPDLPVLHDPK
jgi:uncharacterized protein (DUF1330 family)